MKKITTAIFLNLVILIYGALPAIAAVELKQPTTNGGVPAGSSTADAPKLLSTLIQNAIALVFAFSSIAFVAIFFWGVVDWIWAAGDKEGIAKARAKITQSIIGLVLLSLSFAIMAIISQITSIKLVGDIVLPSFMNP